MTSSLSGDGVVDAPSEISGSMAGRCLPVRAFPIELLQVKASLLVKNVRHFQPLSHVSQDVLTGEEMSVPLASRRNRDLHGACRRYPDCGC